MTQHDNQDKSHDFIIVGSGAGGGPLAANLALAGFSVLLIEAGSDKINDNYSVPAYHALSTEDPLYSWEFFVNHYSDNPQRDPKHHPQKNEKNSPRYPGVFYPRASGIGGCTTHHAMITVYPHESDWDYIANLVNDKSWCAKNMRQYFDRIERPRYGESSALIDILDHKEKVKKRFNKLIEAIKGDASPQHKKQGWLSITQADPKLLLKDIGGVKKFVIAALHTALKHGLTPMPGLNPNNPSVAEENREGINVIPISVDKGKRTGTRERILQTKNDLDKLRDKGKKSGVLDIATNTFVTNVVFDEKHPTRAIGVRCIPGEGLYSACHPEWPSEAPGEPIVYLANKEVILCGGAFNTPQLLMLSGIGPREELERPEISIDVRVDSYGVGKNLQDRYEVGVIAKASKDFKLLEKASFESRVNPEDPDPDPIFTDWREKGKGIYATNGAILGIIKRSSIQKEKKPPGPPDLYIFGVPGYFGGYAVGYSPIAVESKNYFTWAVLKGHTDNTSGFVSLKSADPFDTPLIHFKYFEESKQDHKNDLKSVVEGVEFIQKIYKQLEKDDLITEQVAPPPGVNLETFVKDNAWGHHASCTCPIGPIGKKCAVLDKDFQVQGTENLRVVDASVFPKIPGLFILASVYMISEKASDVIINKYK